MKVLKLVFLNFLFLTLTVACQQQSETPEPLDYGYLSLNLSLTIASEPANGRTLAVNTDDFRVTIFAADGTEVMMFDPFSTAPAEVQLPTGEYYVEAHSNNLVDAAFENPYYFGRSDNFTIDKEELKSIDIEAELANTKVAINYSANVVNTFHSYTGTVTVVSSGASLFYGQGETREGYFLTSPLDVEVNLSYTKLDGTTIDRTYTASIADPKPKTLYNINVDATLEDGKVVFNITVDEGFDTVDIELGGAEVSSFSPWSRNYGSSSYDNPDGGIIATRDGGYLVAVQTSMADFDVPEFRGVADIWVFKVDADGVLLWSKVLGGSNIDFIGGLVEGENGYLVVGSTQSSDGDVSQRFGSMDAWLVMLNVDGSIAWEKSYGSQYYEMAYAAVATSDGGFAVTGNSNQVTDMWIFKIDALGNMEWENTFGGNSAVATANDIVAVNDGYLACGFIDVNGNRDFYIAKVDLAGDEVWQRQYGGSGSDEAKALIDVGDGYVVTGWTSSADGDVTGYHGGNDLWVIKLAVDGSLEWQKSIGGSDQETGYDIDISYDNNIVITGDAGSNDGDLTNVQPYIGAQYWLVKISPSGQMLWNHTYGRGFSTGFAKSHDGGYILSGSAFNLSGTVSVPGGHGNSDVWLLKVDQDGIYQP